MHCTNKGTLLYLLKKEPSNKIYMNLIKNKYKLNIKLKKIEKVFIILNRNIKHTYCN